MRMMSAIVMNGPEMLDEAFLYIEAAVAFAMLLAPGAVRALLLRSRPRYSSERTRSFVAGTGFLTLVRLIAMGWLITLAGCHYMVSHNIGDSGHAHE